MKPVENNAESRKTADAVARRSYGKLLAFLAARTGDVTAAEDALSEAFVIALANWAETGCPANPEAWLMTVASRKAIDAGRRRQSSGVVDGDFEQITALMGTIVENAEIPDRRLALMFACAHPAIDACIRAPLTLQVILRLDVATIASAFLMSPSAMAKRLNRAKKKIRAAGIPFRIPEQEELAARVDTVLESVYAAFTEGWSDAAGSDAVRRDLAQEALFLARLVVELLPAEPEALGLLALMLHAEARRGARRAKNGGYIPLAAQDPALWDEAMIDEAERLLLRAGSQGAIGRYQIEAALQSAHAHRLRTGRGNWEAVLQLYDALLAITSSPVVATNRALAIAELAGPHAALDAMPKPADNPGLFEYQPYWAVRADLLTRAGLLREAHHAYEIATGLERDPAVRHFLDQRKSALAINMEK